MTWERASGKAVAETETSPNLKNLLDFRPPELGRAGHDSQVLRHLNLAAAVWLATEDEDLAFRAASSHNLQ